MRAEVIGKSLIIDGEEQKVGTVINVSEGLCRRSVKLQPDSKATKEAALKNASTKTGTK